MSACTLFLSLKLLSCVITRSAFVTSPAQEAQETQEVEELTTENCEAKLKELKADLDQTAPLPRDTSFDR